MGGDGVREIGVGLLGLGNVGAGVVKLLTDNAAAIEARLGARVVVRAIAVREPIKKRLVPVDAKLITKDVAAVLDDPAVEIVCELVGGVALAREYVLGAIARGKSVVTANKALLAEHGPEIFAAAEAKGVDVYFEAAVCGGVPVVRALREGLVSDRVEEFYGIVNGTSNFILTAMASGGTYDATLKAAQAAGYAEADPTLDVGGGDAAHKLAILALLCFGTHVAIGDILVEGIERLEPIDFELARRFGYVVKPLVYGRDHGEALELRVHPMMVPHGWLLAAVDGAKNALYVRSYALGASMYYGAGAGMMPTATAVVSDVIEVCRNLKASAGGREPVGRTAPRPVRSADEIRTRYYVRFAVLDRPGVLGQITTILGEHEISIAQVLHEGARDPGRPVTVVVLTHQAREANVRQALRQAANLSFVVTQPVVLRVAESGDGPEPR